MITLRYHIVSLAAILLTLGIGIWIGAAIGSPGLTQHQLALIKESDTKLDSEISQREDDAKMLDQNRQALAGLVPHFTRSLLSGKHVAIIRTGDYPDAAQEANDGLAPTGAVVESTITIGEDFDNVTDKQRYKIVGLLSASTLASIGSNESTELMALLVSALKNGTTNHTDVEDAIEAMSDNGLISYSGDFQQPVDLVIAVGGSATAPGEIDSTDRQNRERMIVNTLVSANGFSTGDVVGCEPRAVGTSSIPVYEQAGIASVDCVDEPLGVLDLVYALHGESATYGVKPGANLLAPASLENQDGLL